MTGHVGAALREVSEEDPRYGGFLNADFAEYVIPVNADIGSIEAEFIDEPAPGLNMDIAPKPPRKERRLRRDENCNPEIRRDRCPRAFVSAHQPVLPFPFTIVNAPPLSFLMGTPTAPLIATLLNSADPFTPPSIWMPSAP